MITDWRGIPEEYRSQVVTGDARTLAKALPDESIDLIFTDPPYPREYLYLYEWLAEEAARVLRPGGWCLAMCGGLYLDQIMRWMGDSLTYFWVYQVGLAGQAAGCVRPYGARAPIITRTKPMLAYSKGITLPRTVTHGLFMGTGADKQYHAWGQDTASSRYYVDCFSRPGDVVLDPFCGGGTTPYICEQLGRRWVSFEVEEATAEIARGRLTTVQMPLLAPSDEQARMELMA